jgi:hypothetical protein
MQVADLMRAGRGVLLDLAARATLREAAADWAGRVDVTTARCYERPANIDGLLIRPDGYVAWVVRSDDTDQKTEEGLRFALGKWFGAAGVTGLR